MNIMNNLLLYIAAAFFVCFIGITHGIVCYKCESVGRNGNCPRETIDLTCTNSKYCARTKALIAGKPDETSGCDTDFTVEWFKQAFQSNPGSTFCLTKGNGWHNLPNITALGEPVTNIQIFCCDQDLCNQAEKKLKSAGETPSYSLSKIIIFSIGIQLIRLIR